MRHTFLQKKSINNLIFPDNQTVYPRLKGSGSKFQLGNGQRHRVIVANAHKQGRTVEYLCSKYFKIGILSNYYDEWRHHLIHAYTCAILAILL